MVERTDVNERESSIVKVVIIVAAIVEAVVIVTAVLFKIYA